MRTTLTLAFCLLLAIISFPACNSGSSADGAAEVPVAKAQQGGEDVEEKLKSLGITLPEVPPPVANYVNAVQTGNLIFLAGKGPNKPEGGYITGKVGADLDIEQGYEAARLTGIIQLAALKAEIGDLNRVKRIVKVLGMVNAAPDFTDHPKVINGFSDLMVEVFGDKGKHARAAVGMGSLPTNIAVEIEMIVEVE
jgi:enamine deaminase RidA (YjgF/YER057c/UK114 family)